MASPILLLLLLSLLSCLLLSSSSSSKQIPKHYIVYMGSALDGDGRNALLSESDHIKLLSTVIPSEEKQRISLIHHYSHAFRGFSAMLTEDEASLLSQYDGIVSVFPDSVLQLHTTRSWDFLEVTSSSKFSQNHQQVSSDVIVGIIDTGIWPESPSFSDDGIGQVPRKWKGICMEGSDFKKSNCNRKLIGARYYVQQRSHSGNGTVSRALSGSPRDSIGHGTHTASTAAGSPVMNASYYGLGQGTARGGSPSTRIAAYKACAEDGCSGATILKAIEDAIKDGVDIISISIGMNALFQSDFLSDPIAIGAFHAEEMGVMVVCSAGNDGPSPSTVVNAAPWIFTVAASTIDRAFQSTVLLGNGRTFRGFAINFSNLTRSETYPLVFGKDAAAKFSPVSEARNCYPGSLDPKKVSGKIVVCIDTEPMLSRRIKKLVVEDAKAKGMIFINEESKGTPFDSGVFPFTEVGIVEGYKILKYMTSDKNPTATILPTVGIPNFRPAPVVAYFSSRGPGGLTENILKPDIMAPGVAILAAVTPKAEPGTLPIGKEPSGYAIRSGTSMACPHVTGAAAVVKSVHPGWSTSMIKSALMTTATVYDNLRKPTENSSGQSATPHEMGVGEISPLKALNPGLVFKITTQDYLKFLCYYGSSEKNIHSLSKTNFKCPRKSSENLISTINYPSISIGKLDRHGGIQTIGRTVTNVGTPNATYIAAVSAPSGLVVKVLPQKIAFGEGLKEASFKVSLYGKEAPGGYNFGSITWSDGLHSVRMVIAVNVE
ncbi:hypothetical protein SLA2020_480610 [Shorea laevis]